MGIDPVHINLTDCSGDCFDNVPVDASLEIDHINHNKTDCRLQNLRLVTHLQNERAKPTALSPDVVRTIRRLYAAGGVTQERLAVQFGISRHSVSRITRRATYAEVETDD
ncbi:HNH endonuclease [Methanorbis rubei]|uniref:HNH endonuclease n=1 Tax=Methanorbis rubei TaxID=3028300 RepID=UPI003B84813B